MNTDHIIYKDLYGKELGVKKPSYGFPNLTPGKIYQSEFVKTNNNIGENKNYKLVDDSGSTYLYPKLYS